jgi:23S rRNA (cytosine1962-C5)-methyltransferase
MTAPPFSLPVLRLKPKADARRIRHGHPWAWTDDLVLDRRSRGIPAGALAVLEDAERQPLGLGVATVEAKIGLRLLDRDPGAVVDRAWFDAKIGAAMALRTQLFEAPFYRLVHAEGDGLPGLMIDRFGDVLRDPAQRRLAGGARLDVADRGAAAPSPAVTTLIKNAPAGARARSKG